MARGGGKKAAVPPAPLVKDPAKYKTELCATYSRTGACPYGHKCQFAHGVEELRARQDQPSSYKTKACRSFARTGRCPYGLRCRFMHGDFVEGQLQHLATAGLADERPTPFSSSDVRVIEGSLKLTLTAHAPAQSVLYDQQHQQHALNFTAHRRSSSSSESEEPHEFIHGSLSPRGAPPMTPPSRHAQAAAPPGSSEGLSSPPHAVLLPYAQLPHCDGLKLPCAPAAAGGMWSTGMPFAQTCGSMLSPPLSALPPTLSPGMVTPTSLTSPVSSVFPSALPSALPSAAPSNLPSAIPSPALMPTTVLPLPFGASPISCSTAAAMPAALLPPAALPAAELPSSSSLMAPMLPGLPSQAMPAPAPAPGAGVAETFGASRSGLADVCSSCSCASGGGALLSSCEDGACAGGVSSRGGTFGGMGGFADMGQFGDTRPSSSSSTFMQHSIAKQLSVLFDESTNEKVAPRLAEAHSTSDADCVEGTLLDASTMQLADRLAAVCCSPPRPARAGAGSRW